MVEQRGIEPLTSALRTRRSAKLSYCPTPTRIQFQVSSFKFQVYDYPQIAQIRQTARKQRAYEHGKKKGEHEPKLRSFL